MATLISDILHKYQWEVLPHPLYSPDMSPTDFDLFPKLKEPLHEKCFSSTEEQAHSQGGASGCNGPNTHLGSAMSNLQNIIKKHADQPTKKCVTSYCIHKLPLLNYCGWKQLIFSNV
jgi:hypothetical protein